MATADIVIIGGGITVRHGKVQFVQTPQETIHTNIVINATGAYSSLLARLVGIGDLPVYPVRRQLYLTEPCIALPDDVSMTVDLSTGFHFRRRGDRILLTAPLPFDEAKLRNSQLPLTVNLIIKWLMRTLCGKAHRDEEPADGANQNSLAHTFVV